MAQKQFTIEEKMQSIEDCLKLIIYERDDVIHSLNVGLTSSSNVLLLGPPGVAKSFLVSSWAKNITDTAYFQWLLTKFTTPEELFGSFSLKGLQEDRFTRNSKNKLQEAHVAFLDEIWKANSGILNSLLTLLNEKIFYDDGIAKPSPLYVCVGASNELPEDNDGLNAMLDRFPIKHIIKPIQEESNFAKMLNLAMDVKIDPKIDLNDIIEARELAKSVKLPSTAIDMLAEVRKKLIHEGLSVTDRTYHQSVIILKAEAALWGRSEVTEPDFDFLRHVLWTDPDTKKKVYTHVLEIINPIKNKILELYDDATDLYDTIGTIKDKDEKVKKGVETANKLKEIKQKLNEHKKTLQLQGKDLKEISAMEDKLDKYIREIFQKIVGIPPFVG